MSTEEWRTIEVNDNYMISNMGQVLNSMTNTLLKPLDNGTHFQVALCRNGEQIKYCIHKLVAQAFLENPNNYEFVDHINRDGYDNRVENLRLCTHQQNMRNRTKRENTGSKYKGVDWHKRTNKWRARINPSGKSIHLGLYISEIDAALVYNYFSTKLFKEFAVINEGLPQEYTEYVSKRIKDLELKHSL